MARNSTPVGHLRVLWQRFLHSQGTLGLGHQYLAGPTSLPALAVSRFVCHSDLYEMDLHIDINTELFPLQVRVHE